MGVIMLSDIRVMAAVLIVSLEIAIIILIAVDLYNRS